MVLYTVIGEYDVLYAQSRELSADNTAPLPQKILSTDLRDFLGGTTLVNRYTKYKTNEVYYNEYY
ncbi:MAG: hypothetical protein HDT24_10525 [Ruminococcus sp.]|nr:hypothetical protein [Ruminococcus sp.]